MRGVSVATRYHAALKIGRGINLIVVGGPDMAPHTPQGGSERPGGAVALLDHGSHFHSWRRSQSITWRVQIQA